MELVKKRFLSLSGIMELWSCVFISAAFLVGLYRLLPSRLPFPWALWRAISPTLKRFSVNIGEFSNFYQTAADVLVILGVMLVVWLVMRLRFSFILLLSGALAFFASLTSYGMGGHSASLYLLAAGLIPRLAILSVSKTPAARGLAAVFALPFVAFCLSVTFVSLPADTGPLRYNPLATKVEEVKQGALERYWSWQNRNMALPSFDLAEEYHARLGGPIAPNDARMLYVITESPLLLKASVYDYYTGGSWEKSEYYLHQQSLPSPDALSNSAIPFLPDTYGEELTEALGLVPAPGLEEYVKQVTATVTLLHPQEARLFYTGRLESFSSEYTIEPYVEMNSELKSLQLPQVGASYDFYSVMLDRTRLGFNEAINKLPNDPGATHPLLNDLSQSELRFCRQIPLSLMVDPEYLPAWQLVLEIITEGLAPGKIVSPYEQAVALERWLKNNCRYSMTPADPPEDEDFVLHFLRTREGYCTYYASAMVMMSRMLGIPARYVTGYSLRPTARVNKFEATNATAHAWAELFFTGVGWLTFDPTGFVGFEESSGLALSGTMQDRDFYEAQEGGDNGNGLPELSPELLWQAPLTLLVFVLLLVTLRLRRRHLAYDLQRLLHKRVEPGRVLEHYYRDTIKQVGALGWQQHPGETILSFARRMGVYLPALEQELRAVGTAVSALRYGDVPPTVEELQNAAQLHARFKDMMKQKLKRHKYLHYCLWQGAGLP